MFKRLTIAALSLVLLTSPIFADGYTGGGSGSTSILPIQNGGNGSSTPGVIAGSNVTITGIWPNQVISSTGGGGSISLGGAITGAWTVGNCITVATGPVLSQGACGTTYTLPVAASGTLGGVKPDGTTIANAAGAISVTYGTSANTAAQGNDSRITGALSASATALPASFLTSSLTGAAGGAFGTLAYASSVAYSSLTGLPTLGTLAALNSLDYSSLTGLPTLGTLAALNAAPAGTLTGTTLASNVVSSSLTSAAGGSFGTLAYASTLAYSSLTGLPTLGTLASQNSVAYSSLTGLPTLGTLAALSSINNANWSGTVLSVANGGTGTASPGEVAGTNITITGTWPNQTINASAGVTGPGSSVSGNLPSFNGTGGNSLQDSGVSASSLVTATSSTTLTNKSIAASEVNSGTLAAAQEPAYTGDCKTTAGTVAVTCYYKDTGPGYIAGYSYIPAGSGGPVTGATQLTQTVGCSYGYVRATFTIQSLGVNITTAGTTNVVLGIYSSVSGRPGSLIANTGNIVNTSTGYKSGALLSNYQLISGTPYWFCFMTGDNTMVPVSYTNASGIVSSYIGAPSGSETSLAANGSIIVGIQCSSGCNGGTPATLTFPTNLAGSTWTLTTSTRVPVIVFNIYSIP